VKLHPEHFKMELLSGSSVVHKDTQSILTLPQNYFPNWILNWTIILILQIDWISKYLQQSWADFWAPTGLRCRIKAWFRHDFWKGILKNGNGSGSRMFLQVNLKYNTFTSFYWQKPHSTLQRSATSLFCTRANTKQINQAH